MAALEGVSETILFCEGEMGSLQPTRRPRWTACRSVVALLAMIVGGLTVATPTEVACGHTVYAYYGYVYAVYGHYYAQRTPLRSAKSAASGCEFYSRSAYYYTYSPNDRYDHRLGFHSYAAYYGYVGYLDGIYDYNYYQGGDNALAASYCLYYAYIYNYYASYGY